MKSVKKPIKWKKHLPSILIALPGVLYLLVNAYWSFFINILLVLKRLDPRKGLFASPWRKNFRWIINIKKTFAKDCLNTILTGAASYVLASVLAMFIAAMLWKMLSKPRGKILQTTFVLPRLFSWVMIGVIYSTLFWKDLGIFSDFTSLPLSENAGFFLLMVTNIWRYSGSLALFYFAGMAAINPGLYDAAKLDGASQWEQFRYVTLPMLRPVYTTLSILAAGLLFTENTPQLEYLHRRLPVFSHNFLTAQECGYVNAAALMSCIRTLLALVAILGVNWLIRRRDPDNALL